MLDADLSLQLIHKSEYTRNDFAICIYYPYILDAMYPLTI